MAVRRHTEARNRRGQAWVTHTCHSPVRDVQRRYGMAKAVVTVQPRRGRMPLNRYVREFGPLWALAAPGMALLIMFAYIPMAGMIIVFKDYQFTKGI